jgi:hypothetical protein
MEILVPASLDFSHFETAFLPNFNRALRSTASEFVFDLRQTTFADLMELMSLLIAAQELRRATAGHVRFEISATPAADATNFSRFLQKYQFVAAANSLGFDIPLKQNTSDMSTGRLMAITAFGERDLGRIRTLFSERLQRDLSGFGPIEIDNLAQGIVGEACENAVLHAYDADGASLPCRFLAVRSIPAHRDRTKAPLPNWFRATAHEYPNSTLLDISIADGGIGINGRLGPTFQARTADLLCRVQKRAPLLDELSEIECLKWALSANRSSHLTGPRRGFGLFQMMTYALAGWGGAFYLRSGHCRVVCLPTGSYEYAAKLRYFPGTQVRVLLPLVPREAELRRTAADLTSRIAAQYDEFRIR